MSSMVPLCRLGFEMKSRWPARCQRAGQSPGWEAGGHNQTVTPQRTAAHGSPFLVCSWAALPPGPDGSFQIACEPPRAQGKARKLNPPRRLGPAPSMLAFLCGTLPLPRSFIIRLFTPQVHAEVHSVKCTPALVACPAVTRPPFLAPQTIHPAPGDAP